MIDNWFEFELNSVKYKGKSVGGDPPLRESGQALRAQNAQLVQGETGAVFNMRPDVLVFKWTDWSGGEGQFNFDPQEAGRGVVAALPHMGNWDWAGAWACATGMPLTTVAERLEPARLYDEFVAFRRGLGMEILPLTGGAPPMRRLVEAVGEGRLVCLLADRDLSRAGVEVTLLGEPARMPRGPAALARETGVDLVPVTLAYRDRHLELTFHEPVPHRPSDDGLVTMMQGVADAFSHGIEADPQDWHMMQKVFARDVGAG